MRKMSRTATIIETSPGLTLKRSKTVAPVAIITLRKSWLTGREHKLNTRTPFAELERARAIIIRLQHVGNRERRA